MLSLCVLVLLVGCSSKSDLVPTPVPPASLPDIAFATAVPVYETNTKITMQLANEFNPPTLTLKSSFDVWVINQTAEPIGFPKDYGSRVYVYSDADNTWQEVKNLVIYQTNRPLRLEPKGEGYVFSEQPVGFQPDITTTDGSVMVRVFVQGRSFKDGRLTNEIVAAYLDVLLQP